MLNSSYKGTYVNRFPSPVDAPGASVTINVCKTPAPPAPFAPAPFPTTSWNTYEANKQAVSQELKTKLQQLHMKITGLCGSNPTQVHKALDEYAHTVGKLHFVAAPVAVKLEGKSVIATKTTP